MTPPRPPSRRPPWRGLLTLTALLASPALADPGDAWWDEGWPYRAPVQVEQAGLTSVEIDFTAAFDQLGLDGALLDVRSIRVVPYDGAQPAAPIPYAESYTTTLDDGEDPRFSSGAGAYWSANDGRVEADRGRASQGEGSVKAIIDNLPGGYGYPGVELRITQGDPLTDWSAFEVLLYDVWPEVNESARDQAPDLYAFKLYNTQNCESGNITQGGPPLALGRWNRASVSLRPLHTCLAPDLSEITRMEFHTRDNETVHGNSGLWDDGDQLTLWFDHVRLLDQDRGAITFEADAPGVYYVYFDTLAHEGHPPPTLADLAGGANATVGAPEAGGYLHKVTGADTAGLEIWAAPPIEKIRKAYAAPVAAAPLRIYAARGEFEPLQLVARSPSAQSVNVSISDFTLDGATIPADHVTLHRVDYVPISRLSDDFGRLGDWPDPLYPVPMGGVVDLPAGENQPLWFTVEIPRDAPAGVYAATIQIGAATIPVELEVWDFELPQEIHLASEWGFGWSALVERYGGTGDGVHACYWDLVDAWKESFADHRLTPKGVAWPTGLNYPGGVEYDCDGGLAPEAWGEWGFGVQGARYVLGEGLDNGAGFPSFQIRGPASNWPPNSRPSNFCEQSRGDDPPGNDAYNAAWFGYWGAVSDYLGAHPEYAARGYYHIVNEPQTFEDYDIVAYLASRTKAAAPNVRILLSEQVEPLIYDNPTYPGAKIDIWMPTISTYEVAKAHDRQLNHGEEVWWYFLYGDRPPLPNPTILDRAGVEARITPWLAWLERVEGLVYYATTDWDPNPWLDPWLNDANGDAVMFYPPKDDTIAFDPCDPHSNRLVPSLRWELLREGMEDYEYLWLLNEGDPEIGVEGRADALARQLIGSRTLFSRVPTDLYAARAAIAAALTGEAPPDPPEDASIPDPPEDASIPDPPEDASIPDPDDGVPRDAASPDPDDGVSRDASPDPDDGVSRDASLDPDDGVPRDASPDGSTAPDEDAAAVGAEAIGGASGDGCGCHLGRGAEPSSGGALLLLLALLGRRRLLSTGR